MKKLTIIAALAICSTWNIYADGVIPIGTPQSGVLAFTGTNQTATVTFAPQFASAPAMTFFASTTNMTPLTNVISSTAFTLTVASNGWSTMNGSVAWTATPTSPLIQYGTAIASLSIATNMAVTFTTPFSYTPNVVYSPASMVQNSNQLSIISAVTTTGFTISCVGPETNFWQAIGPAATAGNSTVTH